MDSSSWLLDRPKRSSASSSPEFEFWMVKNPASSQSQLLTADELFFDGVLLPLHLLSVHQSSSADRNLQECRAGPEPEPEPAPDPAPPSLPADSSLPSSSPSTAATIGPEITASISCAPTTRSKRWKDIFKVGGEKKRSSLEEKEKEKEQRRKDRKSGGGGGASFTAEQLNINIWPFSRSRSAGNNASASFRPRTAMSGRKVSSAPCSRSNSRGESSKPTGASASAATSLPAGRRWAASPVRYGEGVPVGRTSPVWQIRRVAKPAEPGRRSDQRDKVTAGKKASNNCNAGARVLNLNADTCIGHRNQMSCRDDDKVGVTGGGRTGGDGGGSLFNLRTFFSTTVVY